MLLSYYLDSVSGCVLFHVVSYGFLMCTAMVCWKDTPYYILLTVGQTMGETSAIQVGYHGSASTQTLVCLSTLSQKGWVGACRRFCVISVHVLCHMLQVLRFDSTAFGRERGRAREQGIASMDAICCDAWAWTS